MWKVYSSSSNSMTSEFFCDLAVEEAANNDDDGAALGAAISVVAPRRIRFGRKSSINIEMKSSSSANNTVTGGAVGFS